MRILPKNPKTLTPVSLFPGISSFGLSPSTTWQVDPVSRFIHPTHLAPINFFIVPYKNWCYSSRSQVILYVTKRHRLTSTCSTLRYSQQPPQIPTQDIFRNPLPVLLNFQSFGLHENRSSAIYNCSISGVTYHLCRVSSGQKRPLAIILPNLDFFVHLYLYNVRFIEFIVSSRPRWL